MKKRLTISMLAVALCVLLAALLSACTQLPGSIATGESDAPVEIEVTPDMPGEVMPDTATAAPETDDAVPPEGSTVLYYPEGADETNAEYALYTSIPEPESYAAKDAVALYMEELESRVVNELLPTADRADGEPVPYTSVRGEVSVSGEFTNIVLWEETLIASVPTERVHTIVVGDDGETGLCQAMYCYDATPIIAQQILNAAAEFDVPLYGDMTLDGIEDYLDLYNGFVMTDAGTTVYIQAGDIADADVGTLTFDIPHMAFYPDFVGDVLTQDAFDKLVPALDALVNACIAQGESFTGAPSNEAISEFLARMDVNGVCSLTTNECTAMYEDANALFSQYFAAPLPYDEGETIYYHLPDAPGWGISVTDAIAEGDAIVLSGVIMAGRPGDAGASYYASARIELTADGLISSLTIE